MTAYEELRRQALDEFGHGGCALGTHLFLSQGMTAWMQALSQCTPRDYQPLGLASPAHLATLPEVRRELVCILAGMLRHQPGEVHP